MGGSQWDVIDGDCPEKSPTVWESMSMDEFPATIMNLRPLVPDRKSSN